MGEDFLCAYEPRGGAVIEPLTLGGGVMQWTAEAETRIARVPPFLRKMVRRRAEDFAREQGAAEVTAAHLSTMAKRRFGEGGPPMKPDLSRFRRPGA